MGKREDALSIGFIELTAVDGAELFVVAGSIYAIERPPAETSYETLKTNVKTASELFVVLDSPATVIAKIKELMDQQDATFGLQQSTPALREQDPPEDLEDIVGQEWYDRQMGVDPDV